MGAVKLAPPSSVFGDSVLLLYRRRGAPALDHPRRDLSSGCVNNSGTFFDVCHAGGRSFSRRTSALKGGGGATSRLKHAGAERIVAMLAPG